MSDERNFYRLLGLSELVSISELCEAAIARKPERVKMQKESTLELEGDGWHVYVSLKLKPARARWRVGHELAHWYFDRIGHQSDRIEQECDALGAALCVPGALVNEAWGLFGEDLKSAADWLGTTQSLVLLRYGECVVTGVSGTAVIESSKVIARSDWDWPIEEEIRKAEGPGLKHVRIDDEAKRAGLIVKEEKAG